MLNNKKLFLINSMKLRYGILLVGFVGIIQAQSLDVGADLLYRVKLDVPDVIG